MKKKLSYLLVVFTTTILFGCEKRDQEPEVNEELENILALTTCIPDIYTGKEDEIIGKWLLVQSRYGANNREQTDRSCEGIIYNFLADGRLIVTTDDTHHLNGEYIYTYYPQRSDYIDGKDISSNITIEGSDIESGNWRCYAKIFEKYMTIVEGDGFLWSEALLRIE